MDRTLLLFLGVVIIHVCFGKTRPPVPRVEHCGSDADCKSSECCVRSRDWYLVSSWQDGTCVDRDKANGRCLGVRKCDTARDCSLDECCIAPSRPKGKKRRSTQMSGMCKRRGTDGDQCLFDGGLTPPPGQHFICPCSQAFSCEPDGFRDIPLGLTGRCLGVRKCDTASDCFFDECCIAPSRPKGKKRRSTQMSGTCEKRGTDGDQCLVDGGLTPPPGQHFICPCSQAFSCEPDGFRDIPLGLTGTCEPQD